MRGGGSLHILSHSSRSFLGTSVCTRWLDAYVASLVGPNARP